MLAACTPSQEAVARAPVPSSSPHETSAGGRASNDPALAAIPSAAPEPATPPADSVDPVATPAPSASASAPTRALPERPDVTLLRELAVGTRPMSEVIDPALGVDLVDQGPSPGDDPLPPPHKACSMAQLAEVRKTIANYIELHDLMSATGDPPLSCSAMTCTKSAMMEWDPLVTIRFAKRGDGHLRLVSIDSVDFLLREPGGIAADQAAIARSLNRLSQTRCAKSTR